MALTSFNLFAFPVTNTNLDFNDCQWNKQTSSHILRGFEEGIIIDLRGGDCYHDVARARERSRDRHHSSYLNSDREPKSRGPAPSAKQYSPSLLDRLSSDCPDLSLRLSGWVILSILPIQGLHRKKTIQIRKAHGLRTVFRFIISFFGTTAIWGALFLVLHSKEYNFKNTFRKILYK